MEHHLHRLIELAEAQNVLLRTFELDCVCQEFEYGGPGENAWVPFPQPTRVHIQVDERDLEAPHRRFRAEYHPRVVRWYSSATAMTDGRRAESFNNSNHTEIGDGYQTTSYAKERRWRPTIYRHSRDIYLTGEHFLLCRFGCRKVPNQIGPAESEPVRLAQAILDPDRSGGRGIVEQRSALWETREDGRQALRLEQAFAHGGRHVYWLDPERGYALLRFAEADGNEEPETLFEVEALSQVASDFWYPARVSSNALCPSPRQTSPIRVEKLSLGFPYGVIAEGMVQRSTTHRVRLPREDSLRCRYEFSNVLVGVEIPTGAFDFHPPLS